MKRTFLLATLTAAALALAPGLAGAHVTVQPSTAPADGFTRIDVRVPNEEADAATTKVVVQFPAGIYWTSYEPVDGWKVTVKTRKLTTPVKVEDDELTSETESVEFTATGDGIEPGQFQDFGLSISTPDKPGEALKFPAVQTYSSGEVVRWIGAQGSDQPAPMLTLTAADAGHHAATESDSDDAAESSSDTIAWIALALGALALALGGSALAIARRRG
ncbi:MAG: YcnI family protein [Solirubrobacterales bacterium]